MKKIIIFQEAITESKSFTTNHLLLGNGFSIACVPSIFTYNSLFEETDFSSNPEIEKAFKKLSTTDFELVINALEKASLVVPAYDDDLERVCSKMNLDASTIKNLLIETIAERHPKNPSEIPENKYKSCRQFLSHFVYNKSKGRIYSLNYDLLLYWTLMHELENEYFKLDHNDGFGRDSTFENGEVDVSTELTWQGKQSTQNIHYLHGALHLFDSGFQLEKFSWIDTGMSLIEQARKALIENKFPLFVSEGNSDKKMKKITHSAYLFNGYNSFDGITKSGLSRKPGNTCLFTYGVSFSENDKHIFNKIANGRLKHLFIGIYGDPNSETNQSIISLAEGLKSCRKEYPLGITYFDSETAKVWG